MTKLQAYSGLLALLISNSALAMNLEQLKKKAFERCQKPYKAIVVKPVPVLDPPAEGGPRSVGMVFQEELSVRTNNFLDQDDFYFTPRPRAAVNTWPMDVYIDKEGNGNYVRKTWEDASPEYACESWRPEDRQNCPIYPPIQREEIPAFARILTEMIIGHKAPDGGYPQLFDLRSSAYVRFAGYPQVTGASLRLGAHNIFSLGANNKNTLSEDFPAIREMWMSLPRRQTARALVLVENKLSCAAMELDMTEGVEAEIVIDGHWYMRRDFYWRQEPHTALVAYSSMSFKTEVDTPERSSDEAHDSDTLRVKWADGRQDKYSIHGSAQGIRVRDLSLDPYRAAPTEWALANEDRDPAHYADFQPALGATNYDLRASYSVQILESNVKTGVTLYEALADGEYGDNIVVASTLRQNIKKATSPAESVHFKYRTKAYLPR